MIYFSSVILSLISYWDRNIPPHELNIGFAPMLSLSACIALFIGVSAMVATVVAEWEQAVALTLRRLAICGFLNVIV